MGERSRGRYATPADFPLHDCTPYRWLRARRWGLGFVRHSRAIFCLTIRNFVVAVRCQVREAAHGSNAQVAEKYLLMSNEVMKVPANGEEVPTCSPPRPVAHHAHYRVTVLLPGPQQLGELLHQLAPHVKPKPPRL